jgi:hypothetical protein
MQLTSIAWRASLALLANSLDGSIRASKHLLFKVCLTSFTLWTLYLEHDTRAGRTTH